VTYDGLSPEIVENFAGVRRGGFWREPPVADFGAAADGVQAYRTIPRGGSFFYVVEIAPRTEVPIHNTPSVEYHCIVAGRITVLLEDGEIEACAGEVLVMRGVPHGWSNRTDERWLSIATMLDHRDSAGAGGQPIG
jgi:quercetin dioxygenase-like cupin family protein